MNQDNSTGWTRFDYSAPDGLRLSARRYGWQHRDRPVVVCLAGLSRNSADFHELALHLASDPQTPRATFAIDYRGRGMSAWDSNPQNYNPLTEADDVLAAVTAAGIGEAAIIGTSRGGLIAMILSALRPTLLKAVVLNDVGPKIGAKGLLRIRNHISSNHDFANWSSAVRFLKSAGEGQFTAFGDADWERQAHAIFEERDGGIHRRYDPALLRTLANVHFDHSLPQMWPQFRGLVSVPVLVIRGQNSDLLEEATVREMAQMHPALDAVTVEGQGHAPDLATGGLPAQIAAFLKKTDPRGAARNDGRGDGH